MWTSRRGVPGPDPRVSFWARITEPSDGEVARVGTSAPPAVVAAVTSPTEAEVARLCARRAELVPTAAPAIGQSWRRGLLGFSLAAAAAAALVVVAWVNWPAAYGTPDLGAGETAVLTASQVIDLGPSIDLHPHAIHGVAQPKVHIAQASASGTVVDVIAGGTRFEVDPDGDHRELTVRAGDVAVHVRGTVFTVDRLPDGVEVAVERGKVQVDSPDGTLFLLAGQRWRSGEGVAALEPPGQVRQPGALDPRAPDADGSSTINEGSSEAENLEQTPAVVASPPPVIPRAERPRSQPLPAVASGPPTGPSSDSSSDGSGTSVREPAPVPDGAAGPWTATDTRPAASVSSRQAEGQGTADDDGPSAPSASQVALPDLLTLRQRFRAGETSKTLLPAIDRFVLRNTEPNLVPMALELRVDVSRRDGGREAFDESVQALLRHRPNHPDKARMQVELGRRWLEVHEVLRAQRYFSQATTDLTDVAVLGHLGIADCEAVLGRPRMSRDALTEALRIVRDPALEDEIKERLNRLDRR